MRLPDDMDTHPTDVTARCVDKVYITVGVEEPPESENDNKAVVRFSIWAVKRLLDCIYAYSQLVGSGEGCLYLTETQSSSEA